jgi:hypothetical protein
VSVAAENLPSAGALGDASGEALDRMTDKNRLEESTPPEGALGFLWEGAVKTHALLGGGLVAVILFALQLLLAAPMSWPAFGVLCSCIIAICVIITLVHALYLAARSSQKWFNAEQNTRKELERLERERGPVIVEAAEQPYHPYHKAKCVLIVRWPNMPFPQGSRVTIAIAQGTHERPLGSGTIRPRQFDQKEVVTLDDVYPNVDNLVTSMLQQNSEMVKQLRIGPAIDLQNVPSAPSPTPDTRATNAIMERQEQ